MSDVEQKPDLPALHRLAYSQDGLFTTRQAQERGVSAQLLAHHARSGRFQRIDRGSIASATTQQANTMRYAPHGSPSGWRGRSSRTRARSCCMDSPMFCQTQCIFSSPASTGESGAQRRNPAHRYRAHTRTATSRPATASASQPRRERSSTRHAQAPHQSRSRWPSARPPEGRTTPTSSPSTPSETADTSPHS